jgi:N-carbamoyl-L-amino-acid hydrolase
MHSRKDALVMASPFAQIVREVALQNEIIGTVGKFDVMPNAPNVIPGRVEMIVELRALNASVLNRAGDELSSHAKQMGGTMQKIVEKPPVSCDLDLQNLIDTTCDVLGLTHLRMPSGAFHDAANMASLCPQAMIFVPSVGGVSHSPDEYTRDEDCVNGANVLLNALLKLVEIDLAMLN